MVGSCCVAQGAQSQVMTWRGGVGRDIGIIMSDLCGAGEDS